MIIPINQNDVRLPFDIVSSRWLLTVSARPDSTKIFPHIMCQGLAYFVEPSGGCNFRESGGKFSWLVQDTVPDGTPLLTFTCCVWSRYFGEQGIINGKW